MTGRLKVELIGGLAVLIVVGFIIAWHQHGVDAAREALNKEHKAETTAIVTQLTKDSEQKIAQVTQANAQQVAQLAVQIGQLSNRMVQLSTQLVTLQQAQA